MESYPSSTLTTHPLSADAQAIMAALRAQYAGRVEKIQCMDSFNGRPMQPQSKYYKTAELPPQTNMHYLGSHSQRERAVRSAQSTLIENPSSYPKPQWTILHKEKERGFFSHSPKTEHHGQFGIQLFQSGDNTFSQWGEDEASDWRLIDHGDDDSLLALNAGNVTVPGSPEPCSRKGCTSWGNQNAGPDVAFPQTLSEISGRKGKVQQLCPSEGTASADRIPTVMQWSIGHLQTPTLTCSKQFEEDDHGQGSEIEKGNRGGSEAMDFFEERLAEVEGVIAMLAQEENNQQGLAKVQFNGFLSEGLDKGDFSMPYTNWRNIQKASNDGSTEKEHRVPPVVTGVHHNHQVLSQVTTGSYNTESLTKIVLPHKRPGKWEPPRPAQGHSRVTLSQELCPKQITSIPKLSSSSSSSEVQVCHQTEQSESTRQPINSANYAQSREKRPVESAAPQREWKKQEHSTKIHSNIPKPSKQRCFASELKDQLNLDRNTEVDVTSTSSKVTLALTSDPRICDASHLSQEVRMCVLEEARRARALVATMVYLDGTTQLDPEQKSTPAVCGFLVLLKKSLDSENLEESGTAEEKLLFLRLEHRPVWAQQDQQHNQDLFTKEMLLQMVCGAQSLVCYKAKDLLRMALTHFSGNLSWKQVSSCQVLDPQTAAWLLDPADSASCFQDLLNKHCSHPATYTPQPAFKKVTHIISSLSHLHMLMVELQNKLQMQGLWQLYFCMEMKMIPLLSAMESHKIYVDKKALKKTSEILGTKMKELEQEAHQAAGQQFRVSSSAQLRQVLFEKLHLHERCENKNLPKTVLKQQSTSEAVLLQLQGLHPLPKIILEYRQVHKIKSTFVDGILSCMTKAFISSTWNQTSAVTGRLSAKHPNFQALPKQPVQITKKQFIQEKEAELVTVHPRAMFIPREGCAFLSADFCQVELRLLAHLSSDPELLKIFQNPEADVFTMLASQWKGIHEDRVSSEDREHAKRIVYSVIYGAGKARLSGILGVSAEEASRFQDSFLQTYREVQGFIQHTVQHCHKYGYVKSIMGRRRALPHIHSADWGTRNQAERQAVNFVVQGSAADLCKMAMIQICSRVSSSTTLTARLIAQIHDELLFEVDDSQVEDFAVLVKETMESLQYIDCLGVSLTVPLKVSVSKGQSWGSMCELNFPHAATHTSH
ncbi:DNA polymerase nu [Electrophorus electricus]|uniref:DNA polymerase nu n=1 Tax=Electrophorus electricus TaxID=8005 RepID=UPI0015CFD7D0|nr:DNA polymerase nu [Electrophorus electricus]